MIGFIRSSHFSVFLLALLANWLPCCVGQTFQFIWPQSVAECAYTTVSWQGGSAPYHIYIAAIYGQVYRFDVTTPTLTSTTFPLTLQAGQRYVVLMADDKSIGAGGSSEVQAVGAYNSSVPTLNDCLNNAFGQVSLDFTFTVSGQAKQCAAGFELSWTGGQEDGPYNFTVIPLDQSFFPFDVPLETGVRSMSDWMLNMTAGTRFTIMMNSGKGYGRGGVAGVYQVTDSGDKDCVLQPTYATGTWPLGVTTDTLPFATLPITSAATSNSAGKSSNPSGGTIAGIAVGGFALLAIIALVTWFILRRRRRRRIATNEKNRHDAMDLGASSEGFHTGRYDDSPGHVDPFPGSPTLTSRQSFHSRRTYAESTGYQDPNEPIYSTERSGSDPMTSTMQSGDTVFNPFNHYELTGEDPNGHRGPSVAAPLLPKAPAASLTNMAPPTRPTLDHHASSSGTKTDLETALLETTSTLPRNNGPFRVVNRGNEAYDMPELPPGAAASDASGRAAHGVSSRRVPPNSGGGASQTAFRRHADAGRVQQEVVDLPPLYTDVPRDEDSPGAHR